ncbi:hypothetical protein [Cytobacillus firmus]|uniref:Uncharacterized protein n=1 Tax=Cytobacillus firmus DS1 TaxID=1307436 RepID=W7KML8_CYTFI|nr:hypothetical protein [Cytobacillus firmus]EWG08625.1 hypothetical protein PBF_23288 [Cytobacillus firmus DS1]
MNGDEMGHVKNISQATALILKELKTTYRTSAKHEKNWSVYKGKVLPPELMMSKKFQLITGYGYELCRHMLLYRNDEPEINEEVLKEASHWTKMGAMCIHNSVILYTLLLELGIFTPTSLHFVQGYYHHKTREDNVIEMIAKSHISVHAWLVVRGSVIDMTIQQEKDVFDFTTEEGNYPFILGKVNDGLLLKGKNEPNKIVDAYIKDFAKYLGISKEEWIERQLKYFDGYSLAKVN